MYAADVLEPTHTEAFTCRLCQAALPKEAYSKTQLYKARGVRARGKQPAIPPSDPSCIRCLEAKEQTRAERGALRRAVAAGEPGLPAWKEQLAAAVPLDEQKNGQLVMPGQHAAAGPTPLPPPPPPRAAGKGEQRALVMPGQVAAPGAVAKREKEKKGAKHAAAAAAAASAAAASGGAPGGGPLPPPQSCEAFLQQQLASLTPPPELAAADPAARLRLEAALRPRCGRHPVTTVQPPCNHRPRHHRDHRATHRVTLVRPPRDPLA